MEDTISILVVSCHDEDCSRILAILSGQNDFLIAGVEKEEAGAIIKSMQLKPDVLLLDLHLSEIDGPEFASIIHRRSPSTAIIMLCDKDEEDYARYAVKAGISGFLLKDIDTDKLVHIIKIVFYGGYYISASITVRVFSAVTYISQFSEQIINPKNADLLLSQTERCIICELAKGLSDIEIAKQLNYSTGAIKNYVTQIKRKIKLKSRIQIVVFSLLYGIINFNHLSIYKNIDILSLIQYNKTN